MNFNEKLGNIVNRNNSILCIGLDIDKEKILNTSFIDFNKSIINQTQDLVCAYKINMAFYEVLGKQGYEILEKTIDYIPDDILVILDGKRNDIANTAKKYAQSLFETLNADAVTINPYLGYDGIKPFLEYKDKCSFILCRTSNPSAVEFQDLESDGKPLYEYVAEKIKQWNKIGKCGAVIGATYPKELKKIREILGEDILLLIPGIGVQGGDIRKTVENGTNKDGKMAIINSSRGIIYNENPGEKAKFLRDEINKYR
jgi:orotidine 5'-phosphate decarboxylase subfamily 2